MPELPEVETVRNMLKLHILDKRITEIEIRHNNIIKGNIEEFINNVTNTKIIDIQRKGKYLIFILDNDYAFTSHLRMEGKYFYEESKVENKHSHVYFKLDNNYYLIYNDVRKFGEMILKHKKDLYTTEPLSKLGEDANTEVNKELLTKKLKKPGHVKTLLLDQSVIAGLGNIYVDEVLFLSKINPFTKGIDLTEENINDIIKYSKIVLDKAINLGGSTIRSFKSGHADGLFQNELLVHTKKGTPCPNCNTIIEKTKVNQRGTYYCPNCQRLK